MEEAIGMLVKVKVENRVQESEGQEGVAKIADEVLGSKEWVYNRVNPLPSTNCGLLRTITDTTRCCSSSFRN